MRPGKVILVAFVEKQNTLNRGAAELQRFSRLYVLLKCLLLFAIFWLNKL